MERRTSETLRVALLFVGSAILLFSCGDRQPEEDGAPEETMMTEYSEDLSVVMSQNGRRSYLFHTPLLEGYSLAREPYREFRKGIEITTYKDDSLAQTDAVLTANYAIYYTDRELWEAKGNVVVEQSDGKTLYTQQLFWNARTRKVYSNVDSKIVQNGGRDVFIGEGFESDEEFKEWRFRRMKGRMEVEMKQGSGTDSTGAPQPAARSASQSAARSAGAPTGGARSRNARPAPLASAPEPVPEPAVIDAWGSPDEPPRADASAAPLAAPAAQKRRALRSDRAASTAAPQSPSQNR